VRAIRAWDAQGVRAVVLQLSGLLVERCMPEFRRRAAGLRQRPVLMEEAIQAMIEQLLREARDPGEVFMTQNFIHYLRCLCADNFSRTLRQEGLSYKRDAQGRPAGRPQHIPRALIEQIDLHADEQDDQPSASSAVADPRDTLGERLAAVEAHRILQYLTDPLDRRIFALRALYKMQWEEIAVICGKTERTMRLRFEKARIYLQECLSAEVAAADASGERNI
jgi:DNA-directed RNA polymerase specialized sigma24 family protein